MQHSIDLDLEEIESRLYSQVYHSTENWDQAADHPILHKVPERQVTKFSVSNHAANVSRYWDAQTQSKSPTLNINTVINSTTEPANGLSHPNDLEHSEHQNNQNVNKSNWENSLEEYIDLGSSISTKKSVDLNQESYGDQTSRTSNYIDFSKDDNLFQDAFFSNMQSKLIQQIQSKDAINLNNFECGPTILNNNTSNKQCSIPLNTSNVILKTPGSISSYNNSEETEDAKLTTKKLRFREKRQRRKQLKQENRIFRQAKREENKYKRLAKKAKQLLRHEDLNPFSNNGLQSFSFVNQINKTIYEQNILTNVPPKTSSIFNNSNIEQVKRVDESTQNNEELVKKADESVVILSDSDSDSDVIEVVLPKSEIVCIDSSSEDSDNEDNVICINDSIVNNIPKVNIVDLEDNLASSSIAIVDKNIAPHSPKLECANDCQQTITINCESEVKQDIEEPLTLTIINEAGKKDEIESIQDTEENSNTLPENNKSSDPIKNTSINEIEKERTELLCTPDSNTNDFIVHDVCNLNKNNFCFNFNLHDSDLNLSGKEMSKAGPSIADVYETESSCSEAGTTTKNRSYFSEVEFESPTKEIFAEPDLAKFSSFITPIRNRNNSNVVESNFSYNTIKERVGVIHPKLSNLIDALPNNARSMSYSSDEYNSDSTALNVKKKVKKKKNISKKKITNEIDMETTETLTNDNINPTTLNSPCKEVKEDSNKIQKIKKKKKTSNIDENKRNVELSEVQENQINMEDPISPNKNNKKSSNKKNIPLTEMPAEIEESIIINKEKKLKKKRKSNQMEDEVEENNSMHKKTKNVMITTDLSKKKKNTNTSAKKTEEIDTLENDNIESVTEKTIECLNSTAEYYHKVDSFFADDILYKELEEKNKPEIDSPNLKNNPPNESIDINTISNNSNMKNEKFSFIDTFRKSQVNPEKNETQTINISSDSETETTPPQIADQSSKDIVLNIFSPEKLNASNGNMVSNPFSFVKNFEQIQNNKKTFKDYWTNDMNMFYNESWGQEDYDLTKTHQSMPSDFSKWPVNLEDKVKSKRRGPMCLRCRDYGHFKFHCPKNNGVIKCSTCGDFGHTSSRCPKSICTTCRSNTQHHTTTCHNCSNYRSLRCPICNYIGHLPKDCPDLWRRYHLTNRDTNALVFSCKMMKPANMIWCSNCATRGHSANECINLRTGHFATYPGIHSYEPVYNRNILPLLQAPPEPEIPVRFYENVNLSQLRNYKNAQAKSNNQKYLSMIKKLQKHFRGNMNVYRRLNYLQNAATNNQFDKRKIKEMHYMFKMLKNSR